MGVAFACRGPAAASPAALDARFDQASRACAKIASCAHAHDAPRDRDPSACVDAWIVRPSGDFDEPVRCIVDAAGCDAVAACLRARGDPTAAAFCRQNAGARTGCDGDRLVTCSADDPADCTSIPCASFGARCGEWKQPGGLVSRACLSPSLCPAGAPEVRCEGPQSLVSCRDGAADRTECVGEARCLAVKGTDGVPSAICEPPAHRHCDAVGKRWCEGGSLVVCQPHGPFGEAVVSDCAALGLACDDHASAGAACVVPGRGACVAGAPRCEGGALAFCAAGRRVHVPCTELGFVTCDPDAHGVDAACTLTQAPASPAP
jgi:hypothetical protein